MTCTVTQVQSIHVFKICKRPLELLGDPDEVYHPLQVLLMSDELKLDEVYCLLCLLTSHEEVTSDLPPRYYLCRAVLQALQKPSMRAMGVAWVVQRGDVTAEAGAGIYFTERRALVEALHHLLQLEALPDADAPPETQAAVKSFLGPLLLQESGGRSALLTRLIELIRVSPQLFSTQTKLPRAFVPRPQKLQGVVHYLAASCGDGLLCAPSQGTCVCRMMAWSHNQGPG